MMNKRIVYIFIAVAAILMIPVVGMQVSDGWQWTAFDFVWAGTVLLAAGLSYELISRRYPSRLYKAGIAVAALSSLLLVWVNAAVGIIGDEDNGINGLYLLVPIVGFVGALAARLRPRGMSYAALAAAALQIVIPVAASFLWRPEFSKPPGAWGVVALNAFFLALWLASAALFRRAGEAE